MPVYMVIADGQCDQIVETRDTANREKRDLEKMGCVVRIKTFDNWADAEAHEDKMRGY